MRQATALFLLFFFTSIPPGRGEEPKDIPTLIQALKSSDREVCYAAVLSLATMGPAAKEAIPALIETLTNQDKGVRRNARWALESIGLETVPFLLRALRSQDPEVCRDAALLLLGMNQMEGEAIAALQRVGSAGPALPSRVAQTPGARGSSSQARAAPETYSEEAASAFTRSLENEEIRHSAAEALKELEPISREVAPAPLQSLQDEDPWVRSSAVRAFKRIGPASQELAFVLVRVMGDRNEGVRRSAIQALGELGASAEPAVPALIQALGDEQSLIRTDAAHALGQIGPEAQEAVPDLLHALNDPSGLVRFNAAVALGTIGPTANDAVFALTAALSDREEPVRLAAVRTLETIATPLAQEAARRYQQEAERDTLPENPPADLLPKGLAGWIRDLKHQDWRVRSRALDALLKMGAEAREAIPVLVEALENEEERTALRLQAATALIVIAPTEKRVLLALTGTLKTRDPVVRFRVAWILGQLGTAAEAAVPELIRALKDTNALVRLHAVDALGKIGPPAQPAVPALVRLLRQDPPVRGNILRALGSIGGAVDKKIVGLLIRAMGSEDSRVRVEAAITLGKIGPVTPEVVPTLVQALFRENPGLRWAPAGALERIGPAAVEAIPALKNALMSGEADLRFYAAHLLGGIGPAAKGAVPLLIHRLKDADSMVRKKAAEGLARIDTGKAREALQRYRRERTS